MVGLSTTDASLKPTVKFFCSYGGKIVPRHPDGKLRYLGGETRILAVTRFISFPELLLKMKNLGGTAASVRCQLPTEDLDALVSITCDEDLANLIEVYDHLASPSFQLKIRAFLFTSKPLKNQVPGTGTSSPSSHFVSLSSSKSSSSSSSSSSAAATAASYGSGCSPRYSTMPRVVMDRSLRHKMLPPLRAPVCLEKSRGKSANPHPVPHPQNCYLGQHHGNISHYYLIHNGNHNHWQ